MSTDLSTYLRSTPLLDLQAPELRALIDERGWTKLDTLPRVSAIYTFVRDQIPFGYNRTDAIAASEVLRDGYGQCNTKTTLLMALLRATGVACRAHGATIHKTLQRGVVRGVSYALAPTSILHSWAEVWLDARWVALEGVILDRPYLAGLTTHLGRVDGPLLGYGVGTADLARPAIDFQGDATSIQMTGVDQDFGAFPDPDAFYAAHGTNMSGLRAWIFRSWVRHRMNRRVAEIRGCSPSPVCALAASP